MDLPPAPPAPPVPAVAPPVLPPVVPPAAPALPPMPVFPPVLMPPLPEPPLVADPPPADDPPAAAVPPFPPVPPLPPGPPPSPLEHAKTMLAMNAETSVHFMISLVLGKGFAGRKTGSFFRAVLLCLSWNVMERRSSSSPRRARWQPLCCPARWDAKTNLPPFSAQRLRGLRRVGPPTVRIPARRRLTERQVNPLGDAIPKELDLRSDGSWRRLQAAGGYIEAEESNARNKGRTPSTRALVETAHHQHDLVGAGGKASSERQCRRHFVFLPATLINAPSECRIGRLIE